MLFSVHRRPRAKSQLVDVGRGRSQISLKTRITNHNTLLMFPGGSEAVVAEVVPVLQGVSVPARRVDAGVHHHGQGVLQPLRRPQTIAQHRERHARGRHQLTPHGADAQTAERAHERTRRQRRRRRRWWWRRRRRRDAEAEREEDKRKWRRKWRHAAAEADEHAARQQFCAVIRRARRTPRDARPSSACLETVECCVNKLLGEVDAKQTIVVSGFNQVSETCYLGLGRPWPEKPRWIPLVRSEFGIVFQTKCLFVRCIDRQCQVFPRILQLERA